MEACNLTMLVRSMEPVLGEEAEAADKGVVFYLAHVPDILLDQYEIRQLILQLARNGLEAMQTGQTLTVKVYQEAHCIFLEIRSIPLLLIKLEHPSDAGLSGRTVTVESIAIIGY